MKIWQKIKKKLYELFKASECLFFFFLCQSISRHQQHETFTYLIICMDLLIVHSKTHVVTVL